MQIENRQRPASLLHLLMQTMDGDGQQSVFSLPDATENSIRFLCPLTDWVMPSHVLIER